METINNTDDILLVSNKHIIKLLPVLLFLVEYPDKPKCVKNLFLNFAILKWIFIYIYFFPQKNGFIYATILCILYHLLYSLDDYIGYSNKKEELK
jgi:hypothetical protein